MRKRVVLVAALIGLGIFGSPEARDYFTKWGALQAGRGVVEYLSGLKTRSILAKKPMEARFFLPDRIEVYETTSCGPFAERTRVNEMKLSDFVNGVEFAPAAWVRDIAGNREAYLKRFCYYPLFGSSVLRGRAGPWRHIFSAPRRSGVQAG